MTIPKEIRLRILERFVEDVTPTLELKYPNNRYELRLSLFVEGDLSDQEAHGQAISKGQEGKIRESQVQLTCHLLRQEFYQVLGASHTLDLSPYGALPLSKERFLLSTPTPRLCQVLAPSYVSCVRRVELRLFQLRGKLIEHLPGDFAEAFPALETLSVYARNLLEMSNEESLQSFSVEELEAHASWEVMMEPVRKKCEACLQSLSLIRDRKFLVYLSFNTAEAEVECDQCGYFGDYALIVSLSFYGLESASNLNRKATLMSRKWGLTTSKFGTAAGTLIWRSALAQDIS